MHFFLHNRDDIGRVREDAIKDTTIVVFPQGPGTQHDDGIETPFCTCPETLLLVEAHQSSNDLSPECGSRTCSARFRRTLNHTCLLKTRDTSKWSMVSTAWSQRGQAAG